MSSDSSDPHRWNHALSKALRAVRKSSALRTQDVADRMGLAHRTYEHFEGGGGKVNLERIYGFAVATESDPFALLAETLTDAPGLAGRSSRNKLVLSLAFSLHDFNAEVGDDIELLETGQLLTAFSEMFSKLTEDARRRRKAIDDLERRIKGWRERPAPKDGEDGDEDEPTPDEDSPDDSTPE